jgi:hypothetical protein
LPGANAPRLDGRRRGGVSSPRAAMAAKRCSSDPELASTARSSATARPFSVRTTRRPVRTCATNVAN